jgi:hypothetical protein
MLVFHVPGRTSRAAGIVMVTLFIRTHKADDLHQHDAQVKRLTYSTLKVA